MHGSVMLRQGLRFAGRMGRLDGRLHAAYMLNASQQQRGALAWRKPGRGGGGRTEVQQGSGQPGGDWGWASDESREAGNSRSAGRERSERRSWDRSSERGRGDRQGRYRSNSRSGGRGGERWGSRQSGRGGDGRRNWSREGGERSSQWRDEPAEASAAYDGGSREDGAYERKSSSSSLASMWIGDVVYGVSPVLAALQAGRRDVHTLYLQDSMELSKRKDKTAIQAATRRAQELGVRVDSASKHDLNLVADNRPHQGLVLDASPLAFEPMEAFPDSASLWPSSSSNAAESVGNSSSGSSAPPLWLCLDEVVDPQNFGAALRSAFFLGASGVLTCHRNSSPLTAVVSKASAGAMELMPVHSCKSLLQTLADAKAKGWQVLGAAAEDGAVSCSSFVLDRPTVLVMGNEGYGLRTTVKRMCDAMLRIDGGQAGFVDSLNVSVATGILLHSLLASAARKT